MTAHFRKLVFRRRSKGNASKIDQSWHIALDIVIAVQDGQTITKAQDAVAAKYGIGDRQVKKIWAKYGGHFKSSLSPERRE
jgi:hypothetical protein